MGEGHATGRAVSPGITSSAPSPTPIPSSPNPIPPPMNGIAKAGRIRPGGVGVPSRLTAHIVVESDVATNEPQRVRLGIAPAIGTVVPMPVVAEPALLIGVLAGEPQVLREASKACRVGFWRRRPERLGHPSPANVVAPVHDDARRVDVIRVDEVIRSPRRTIVVAQGVIVKRLKGLGGDEEDALLTVS